MTIISIIIKLSSAEIFWFSSVRNRQERSVCVYNTIWRPFQICVLVRFKLLTAYLTSVTLPFFLHGATSPSGPGPLHYRHFTTTLRHTTLRRAPLDEWSARRRDLYLTTRNSHKRQTSMQLVGFETAIAASERSLTHALNIAATGIGDCHISCIYLLEIKILTQIYIRIRANVCYI
jgi:hypothetical protein